MPTHPLSFLMLTVLIAGAVMLLLWWLAVTTLRKDR
jgi:hypothetical protein